MSVAIVVPVYRSELLPDEQVSLRHLRHHLGRHDLCQISPASLPLQLDGFARRKYDDSFFTSVSSYSRLMLSKQFYQDFNQYDYLLIYQLDCLVFADQLEQWCNEGYDYIGAPLFRLKGQPKSGFSGACNGGFSLRKVQSFLRVLESPRYVAERVSFLADVFHQPLVEVRPLTWLQRARKRVEVARAVRQGVEAYAAGYSVNEDHFWSGRASYFCPAFRVAPPEVALHFAFETAPPYCFEQNERKLPFGAHGWARYDRTFWESHLLGN
jgi:Protein of unknown function (DUF5672)